MFTVLEGHQGHIEKQIEKNFSSYLTSSQMCFSDVRAGIWFLLNQHKFQPPHHSNFMLVMDFTEQLLSSHFLEEIKITTKKKAEGFTAGKTCKIIACTFAVIMILNYHKLLGCLQKCVVLFVLYVTVALVLSRLKNANISTFPNSDMVEK